ncbi:MAG: leucine-rich repeat protein, partial [Bacilli bacterium]
KENNKVTNKNKILKITALLGLFLLVFGISYALFSVTLSGKKINKITTGKLELELLNESGNTIEGETIGLENAVPITDEEGNETVPYTFTLKNSGTLDAEYSITLEDLELAADEERLDDKYVKYTLKRGDNPANQYTTQTSINLSYIKDRILDAGVIKKGQSISYQLYLWLDYDADNEAMNKVFSTNLKVEGNQDTTSSASRAIIYRDINGETYYADGTIYGGKSKVANILVSDAYVDNNQVYFDNNMRLFEEAGLDLTGVDLSTKLKFNKYISGTATKDENYNSLSEKQWNDVCVKYNLPDEECLASDDTDFIVYADSIKDTKPELYKKLYYEGFLIDGSLYNKADLNYNIQLDDNIESLGVVATYGNVTTLTLPKNLKNLKRLSGLSNLTSLELPEGLETIGMANWLIGTMKISLEELTIPASVSNVYGYTFNGSNIKTINIKGSTESWDSNWSSGYDGIINYLNS